jgi:hypothetical protein
MEKHLRMTEFPDEIDEETAQWMNAPMGPYSSTPKVAMTEWISVNDRLPSSYDWVPVTDGDSKWTIARYAHENIDRKLVPKWQFFNRSFERGECAESGDIQDEMTVIEIKFWWDIWASLRVMESTND